MKKTAEEPHGANALTKMLADARSRVRSEYMERELKASLGRPWLLVEGDDDGAALRRLLSTRSERVHVTACAGWEPLVEALCEYESAFGLIDRDVRTDAECADLRHRFRDSVGPRLFITRGWCLENDLLAVGLPLARHPMLWSSQPALFDRWLRAGALWWSIQRATERRGTRPDYGTLAGAWEGDDVEHAWIRCAGDLPRDTDGPRDRHSQIAALEPLEALRVGIHGKRAFTDFWGPASNFSSVKVELAGLLTGDPVYSELLDRLT